MQKRCFQGHSDIAIYLSQGTILFKKLPIIGEAELQRRDENVLRNLGQ